MASLVTTYQFVAGIKVHSPAGIGFKKWAYQALKASRKLREKGDARWVEVEKVAMKHIDFLIEVEGIEAKNRMLAALRQPEQQDAA
jgi:hypothetical protein